MNLIPYLRTAANPDPVDYWLSFNDLRRWESQNGGAMKCRDTKIIERMNMMLERHHGLKGGRILLGSAADKALLYPDPPPDAPEEDGGRARNAMNNRRMSELALRLTQPQRPVEFEKGKSGSAALFRRVMHTAISLGRKMTEAPYPSCTDYHTASAGEVAQGVTKDFMKKHVASNADGARAGMSVAKIRTDPDALLGQGNAYGKRVPISSVIEKSEYERLAREVRERQGEFTATYEAIQDHFIRSAFDRENQIKRQISTYPLVDKVQFVTRNLYTLHTFDLSPGSKPVGGEERCYVRFSVACDSAGTGWAIHHMADTGPTRAPADGERTCASFGGSVDPNTTFSSPLA